MFLRTDKSWQICNDTPCAWGYSGGTDWAPVIAYSGINKFQGQPLEGQCNPSLPQSSHKGGIMVGMADASARFVNQAVSPQTWYYALCPNDRCAFGTDW